MKNLNSILSEAGQLSPNERILLIEEIWKSLRDELKVQASNSNFPQYKTGKDSLEKAGLMDVHDHQ